MFRNKVKVSIFFATVVVISLFRIAHALLIEYKIKPADGVAGDAFGEAVHTDGTRIIVGAPEQNSVAGAAYVFEWNGSNYIETAKLTASDATANAKYGEAVAIAGDYAFVGAYNVNSAAGAVYVYQWNGLSWQEVAKLTASDSEPQDRFGYELASDGTTLIIGAPLKQDFGSRTGATYIFEESGGIWLETAKLLATDAGPMAEFGWDVDIDGNVAIIGSPASNHASYIFRNNGSSWVQEAKLTPSSIPTSDNFGEAVAIDGDTAIVGDSNRLIGAVQTGSVFVFDHSNGNWTETAMLLGSDVTTEARFGDGVAIEGATILVGAHLMNGSGAYYVFEYMGTWVETDKVSASDGAALDHFAWEVVLAGNMHVAGALGDDDNGPISGSAYVYRSGNPTAISLQDSLVESNAAEGSSWVILLVIFLFLMSHIVLKMRNGRPNE